MVPIGRRIAGASVFAFFIVVALGTSARAQPDHFARGLELFEKGQFDSAAAEFAAAYEVDPRPPILFAWAQARRLSGDCDGAIDLYRRFLATGPARVNANAARESMTRCSAEPNAGSGPEPTPLLPRSAAPKLPTPAAGAPALSVSRTAPSDAEMSGPSRVSVFARVDVDLGRAGGVFAPGVGLRIAGGLNVFASGLLGVNVGAEVGARVAFGSGRWRPFAAAAAPVFFLDGARAGVRGSIGVRAGVTSSTAATIEVGAARTLAVPDGFEASSALGSVAFEVQM